MGRCRRRAAPNVVGAELADDQGSPADPPDDRGQAANDYLPPERLEGS